MSTHFKYKSHGYTMCVKSFEHIYVDKSSYDWKTIELEFKEGELFKYTSTSGWFYEVVIGKHYIIFEHSDFHNCFARITKEEYREHKLNNIIDNI